MKHSSIECLLEEILGGLKYHWIVQGYSTAPEQLLSYSKQQLGPWQLLPFDPEEWVPLSSESKWNPSGRMYPERYA